MLINLVETLYCHIFYSINSITYDKVYNVLSDLYGPYTKYIKTDHKDNIINEYLKDL